MVFAYAGSAIRRGQLFVSELMRRCQTVFFDGRTAVESFKVSAATTELHQRIRF